MVRILTNKKSTFPSETEPVVRESKFTLRDLTEANHIWKNRTLSPLFALDYAIDVYNDFYYLMAGTSWVENSNIRSKLEELDFERKLTIWSMENE